MKKIANATVISLVLVAGCSPKLSTQSSQVSSEKSHQIQATSLPEVDLRSPDTVVKSWWALTEWMRDHEASIWSKDAITSSFKDYLHKMDSLGTGDFKSYTQKGISDIESLGKQNGIKRIHKFDILEVKNESETRAMVIAKVRNITPIPSGMKLDKGEQEDRDYGRDLKFIVEKTPEGWRLSQGWERDQSRIALAKLDGTKDVEERSWHKEWEVKPQSNEPSVYDFTETPGL